MGKLVFAFAVTGLFLLIVWPLLLPVLMGGVIAVLFMPLLERMEKRRISTGLASALLTLGITLVLLVPVSGLVYFAARTGLQQLRAFQPAPFHATRAADFAQAGTDWASNLLAGPKVQALLDSVGDLLPIERGNVMASLADLLRSAGARAAELLGALVAQLPGLLLALVIIVVSVYFFLTDGRRLVRFLRHNRIFDVNQTEQLIHSSALMCRSVILAAVVSGIAQALLEVVFAASTGVPNVALVGMAVLLCSFLPVIGSAPVTLFVAAQQFYWDHTGAGVVLLVAALLVGTLDNFVRPTFLRGSGNLHPLLAFVSAFGGLQVMGFMGVFIGPIIAALFVVTLQILTNTAPEPKL